MRKKFHLAVFFFLLTWILPNALSVPVLAADNSQEIIGRVYEFDGGSSYALTDASGHLLTDGTKMCGSVSVYGTFFSETKDDIPAFKVIDGNISLVYAYTDADRKEAQGDWQSAEDKSRQIDTVELEDSIGSGAVLIQTSVDRKNWNTVTSYRDVFSDASSDSRIDIKGQPVVNGSLSGIDIGCLPSGAKAWGYTSEDIQLNNGCYYRVIIAYKLCQKTKDSKILGVDTSQYEYRKTAEVYEFYAYNADAAQTESEQGQTYNIGKAVRTAKLKGYAGEEEIKKGDPHYGITVGQFYISGYTDKQSDSDENMVFLKNVGDKVTLWFSLKENIDAIGGNTSLKVSDDDEGYDQYFQTESSDFGRGTLIVQYTDYNNNTTRNEYHNYLEANATFGADTKVSLFEEGDYEIALDYEITEDKLIDLIDQKSHYRIYFRFSVRNGNCMVYPFDVATGEELTNSTMTENGFRLDMAKSRYLKVNVRREVMAESADGLVEDTRFNAPAKDGTEYTEDGIYTITVENQYTHQSTTKQIYVGDDMILKAYMKTGLSIPEIRTLVANGASVSPDGSLVIPTSTFAGETTASETQDDTTIPDTAPQNENQKTTSGNKSRIVIAGIAAGIIIVICIIVVKKKKSGAYSGYRGGRYYR